MLIDIVDFLAALDPACLPVLCVHGLDGDHSVPEAMGEQHCPGDPSFWGACLHTGHKVAETTQRAVIYW